METEIIRVMAIIIGLVFGIAYGFTNIGKVIYGQAVSAGNVYIMSASWTAFICAMWVY